VHGGGSQSRPGRCGEEKTSQPQPGFELPIIQPVAQRYSAFLKNVVRPQWPTSVFFNFLPFMTAMAYIIKRNLITFCKSSMYCN
jgi:hypothetical protein